MAGEDVEAIFLTISIDHLWMKPGGAASLGFHLMHLAGSTDRLLTYARGEALTNEQLAALAGEQSVGTPSPPVAALLNAWRATLERTLTQIASTPSSSLLEPRRVGRAQLPSSVLGLLFHAAEHAQRHVGQMIATAKVVRGGEPRSR
jgi:uncharacterized damage-inducible protein DinB